MALVRAGGPGDADVALDVVPLDAGLAEPEFLAEGVHSGHALLQVTAGPDVSEEGHAVMLRFIPTGHNTKMTPVGYAEKMWLSAAESGEGMVRGAVFTRASIVGTGRKPGVIISLYGTPRRA